MLRKHLRLGSDLRPNKDEKNKVIINHLIQTQVQTVSETNVSNIAQISKLNNVHSLQSRIQRLKQSQLKNDG